MNKIERAVEILNAAWKEIGSGNFSASIDTEFQALIRGLVNSSTKTYRYVLPTQLVAKLVDGALDCRCVQAKRGGAGAFDARSFAHEVIVPFDRDNHNVLGGAAEPYVSKPLRCEEISNRYRSDKRDKEGWDHLCQVLQQVESTNAPEFTRSVFLEVLNAIHERLETVHIVYPIPNRIRLESLLSILTDFLKKRTGGIRFETIIAATFETIGDVFGIYSTIKRTKVNAADVQSGTLADVECYDEDGRIVAIAEAKDRTVTIRHVEDKLPSIRERGIPEAFFLYSSDDAITEDSEISSVLRQEFSAGHNIYLINCANFLKTVLSLVGETGRRTFMIRVGDQLDQYARLTDRQEWAELLRYSGRDETG